MCRRRRSGPVATGAGAEVDDPVAVRHDRLVVRDDDDRLAGVDEPVKQAEQQVGGRLVEDIALTVARRSPLRP